MKTSIWARMDSFSEVNVNVKSGCIDWWKSESNIENGILKMLVLYE